MKESDFKRIYKNKNMLDVLIAIEDMLDQMDIYTYKNWFYGEIEYGPKIERYWVTVALSYPWEKMPDPYAIRRLRRYDIKIKFSKIKHEVQQEDPSDMIAYANRERDEDQEKKEYLDKWLVVLTIPRRFVENVLDDDLVDYENVIDVNDVSDARDEGLDNKTEFEGATEDEDEENPFS